MLNCVCHARHAIFIAEVANIDIYGSTGLVRLRIVNKQGFKSILQQYDSIFAVVQRRFFQAIG